MCVCVELVVSLHSRKGVGNDIFIVETWASLLLCITHSAAGEVHQGGSWWEVDGSRQLHAYLQSPEFSYIIPLENVRLFQLIRDMCGFVMLM